jgi:uncharacterized membrane protein YfcA
MVLGVPAGEFALLVVAVMVAGVATGILAGLFGVGGGGIIVPVLYDIFRFLNVPDDVRMQLAVGTSMAIIIPTTIRSYRAHRARGAGQDDVLRQWALPAVVGVAVGAVIAYFAPSAVFKAMFMAVVTTIAIKLLFGKDSWRISDHFPGRAAMAGYGFVIGLTSSLMGVGGGAVSNMIQTLHGKSIHNAVATSAGLGVPITIAGTIGLMIAGWPKMDLLPPLSIGYVSLVGTIIMAPMSSFTAPYGAMLAHRMSRRHLEIAFGLFLVLVSTRIGISLF